MTKAHCNSCNGGTDATELGKFIGKITPWENCEISDVQVNDDTVVPKANVEYVARWPRNMSGNLTTNDAVTRTLTKMPYLCESEYTPERHHVAVMEGISHYIDTDHMKLYTSIAIEGEMDFDTDLTTYGNASIFHTGGRHGTSYDIYDRWSCIQPFRCHMY